MSLEPLEPRLLMSADPLGALGILDTNNPATTADYQAVYDSIDVQALADDIDTELQFTGLAAEPLIDNSLQRGADPASQSFYTPQFIIDNTHPVSNEQLRSNAETIARQEIVFIDAGVEDYQSLLAGIQPAGSNTHYQVVFLQGDSNGIEQISATLKGQQGVDAIHVLAHGSSSGVLLGNSWLNASTLSDYEDELASWNLALDDDADLLIYGCDLASNQLGQSLLRSLGDLTGADIAASDDLTGTETLGGDWELEFHLGSIETAIAVSQVAQQAWQGTLAYESFDYGGGPLSGNNGGIGWADAWAGGNGLTTNPNGLTSPTGTLPVEGGSVKATGGSFGHSRHLDAALGADGTTAWVSFLVEPDTGFAQGLSLVLGESEDDDVVSIGTSGDDFRILRDFESGGSATINGAVTEGQTYLLVVRLDFADDEDTITLYVDPTPGLAAPDSVLSTQLTTADLGSFTRVGIGGGFLGSEGALDEIRTGTTFAEVTGAATGNLAPTFTAFAGPVETTEEDDNRVRINFGELAAQGNEADADGTVTGFVVQSIVSGSLRIGGTFGTSSAWAAGSNDVIDGDNRAFWTPAPDVNGTLDAFTVVARDEIGAESATAVTAQVVVTPENDDPVNIGAFPATNLRVLESGSVFVDLSAIDLADIDAGSNDARVVLSTNSGGLLTAANGVGVAVSGSGSSALTLTGAIADLNLYLNNATGISVSVAVGVVGDDGESIDVVVNDNGNVGAGGGADIALGTVDVDIIDRIVTVTTELDENDGDTTNILTLRASPGGTGISLREAIAATNNTLIAGSPDWIVLPSGDYLISGGELVTTDDVLILGGGARTTTIDAELSSRVFNITSGVTLMSGVTITGGSGHGGGAIVENGATLNLSDATLTNNEGDDGGAIHVHGSLILDGVTLSGNTATDDGGALAFHGADSGSIVNSTISGNTAVARGGGLWTDSAITITSSTIAFNVAAFTSGGIFSVNAFDVTLTNTILYNPVWTNSNIGLTSGGSNIDSDGSAALGDPLTGSDPVLNALADNGGPTDTHSLGVGSAAVNPGTVIGAPANDQRGFARDGTPDIGAFERRTQPPSLDLDGNDSTATGNHYFSNFTEGGLAASLADIDMVFSDADSVLFDAVTLDVSELLDGNAETIILDGSTFMLATAVLGQDTAGLTYRVAMTVGPGTASVTITRPGGGQFTTAEVETLIRAIRYQHTDDDNPTAGIRQIGVRVDDGIDLSASAFALFDIVPVNDDPTLTSFLIPATVTAEDTEIAVSFLDLIATGDENDVDGTVDAFVVQGVSSGTLLIGVDAATATAWAAGTNDTIDASNNAYWTPGQDATGNLNAFTVVAQDDDGQESASAVTVQINATNENDAPTFTLLSGLIGSTNEDTEVAISLADLLAVGDEADIDGSVTAFVVKSLINGTLTIGADAGSATAWVAGVNDTIDALNDAFWTPDTEFSGTSNAFSLVARDDGGMESAPAITAQINVTATNDVPTFTVLTSPVDTTAEETEVEISLADLLAAGDEADVDGSVVAFIVQGVSSGTLTIGANAGAATAWVAGVNDTINAGNHAYWTPAGNATGTLNAFTVVAQDDGGASSVSAIAAQINVTATNDVPTFTVLTSPVDTAAEETEVEISLADLLAAGDEADVDGSVVAFIVQGVTSGTLTIGANAGAATAWVAGVNDTINAGNRAYWTPADNTTGTLNAFTVVAQDDGGANSASAITAQINVTATNDVPTFTVLTSPIDTTAEDTQVEISLADLQAAGDEADVDGSVVAFIVQGVTSGTLTIGANAGAATAWIAGVNDTVDSSNNAYWTPVDDTVGTLNAFTVVAQDDSGADSASAITAQISVTGTNDAPTFTVLTSPVDTTAEETAVEISLADLLTAGDEADVDGSVVAFIVQGVASGTLTIGADASSATAWVAGVNDTIDASNRAYWTPADDTVGRLNAFTVVARDDSGADSASAVTVRIGVTDMNDVPTFTVFTSLVDTTAEDTTVEIDLADLLASGDAGDTDGTVDAFVVRAVLSGTLAIGADAGSARAWAEGVNDTIDATDRAFWTPGTDANGALNAFTVVAKDSGGLVSLDAVTAQIDVSAANDAPTFTMLSDVVASSIQSTEVEVSLADLLAVADASDVDSTLAGFVVRAVSGGTLRIGSSPDTAVAWEAGINDTIDATTNVYWTPGADDTGTLSAFVIVAVDAEGLESAEAVTAEVDVTAAEPPVEPPVEPPPTFVLTPEDLGNLGSQINEEPEDTSATEEPQDEAPATEPEPEDEGAEEEIILLTEPETEGFNGTAFVGGGSDNEISQLSGRFEDANFTQLVSLFGDSSDFSTLSPIIVDSDITVSPAFQPITIGDAGTSFDTFVDPMVLIGSKNFSDGLDKMREELQQELVLDQTMLGGTVTVTAGFSVGYLVWLTRSGALLGAALSALPAWRFMDPLPILANSNLSDDEEDEESLESMVNQVDDEPEASLEDTQEEEPERSPQS